MDINAICKVIETEQKLGCILESDLEMVRGANRYFQRVRAEKTNIQEDIKVTFISYLDSHHYGRQTHFRLLSQFLHTAGAGAG